MAASPADSSGPDPPIVAAVAMMIDIAMRLAKTEPAIVSIRSCGYSSAPMPRSATAAAWYSCMYGVIVVPMIATARNRKLWVPTKCGQRVFFATSPQSGSASTIETGYARNTSESSRKIRSARRYEPRTTTLKITIAAIGTEM